MNFKKIKKGMKINLNKFFVGEEQIKDGIVKIVDSDTNHIKNVLRLNLGEKIIICNKNLHENYICEIVQFGKEEVICNIVEKTNGISESNVKIDIFQGLPKADKMELIIQKGTELRSAKIYTNKF